MNLLLWIAYRLIFVSTESLKVRFRWESRKQLALEHQRSFFKFGKEKPLIRQLIGSIGAQYLVRDRVYPNLHSYSFRFQFQIIILVNFNFGFSWFSILEISLLFNWWFLCESWSRFSDFWFQGFDFKSYFQKYQIS